MKGKTLGSIRVAIKKSVYKETHPFRSGGSLDSFMSHYALCPVLILKANLEKIPTLPVGLVSDNLRAVLKWMFSPYIVGVTDIFA